MTPYIHNFLRVELTNETTQFISLRHSWNNKVQISNSQYPSHSTKGSKMNKISMPVGPLLPHLCNRLVVIQDNQIARKME
jgi:hypothetical protein